MTGESDILMGAEPLFYAVYVAVSLVLVTYVLLRVASSKVGLRFLRSIVHRLYRR